MKILFVKVFTDKIKRKPILLGKYNILNKYTNTLTSKFALKIGKEPFVLNSELLR